jgi:hypothetical protein
LTAALGEIRSFLYIPCTTCWISGAAYGWLFTDRRPKDYEGPYRRRGIKKVEPAQNNGCNGNDMKYASLC